MQKMHGSAASMQTLRKIMLSTAGSEERDPQVSRGCAVWHARCWVSTIMTVLRQRQEALPSSRVLLRHDHQRLDALFTAARDAFASGAHDVAAQRWQAFEFGILQHLTLEETVLFPALATVDAGLVAEFLGEHCEIRKQVELLGIAVDQALAPDGQELEFARTLAIHAEREDRLLYPWAESVLDRSIQAIIRVRLRDTVRQCLEEERPHTLPGYRQARPCLHEQQPGLVTRTSPPLPEGGEQ